MISSHLIHTILTGYAQARDGIHGPIHWARVLENGLRLARLTGARIQVVQLFAVFHDAKRVTESLDHGHGQRGADYAASLRGVLFDLSDQDFELLYAACRYHTDGLMEGDITLQTCWDADRLDLGRANIAPRPQRLCTQAAQDPDVIQWAEQRSRAGFVPPIIHGEWGLEIKTVP
ncbi:MAG: hypothetical protein JW850_02915 [Thermoflexales bacterium]|nr:hypothetical protein [Thermoflexales bacterium]